MKYLGVIIGICLVIALCSIASSQDLGYTNKKRPSLTTPQQVTTTFNNATANVNNSNYLQGFTPEDFWKLYSNNVHNQSEDMDNQGFVNLGQTNITGDLLLNNSGITIAPYGERFRWCSGITGSIECALAYFDSAIPALVFTSPDTVWFQAASNLLVMAGSGTTTFQMGDGADNGTITHSDTFKLFATNHPILATATSIILVSEKAGFITDGSIFAIDNGNVSANYFKGNGRLLTGVCIDNQTGCNFTGITGSGNGWTNDTRNTNTSLRVVVRNDMLFLNSSNASNYNTTIIIPMIDNDIGNAPRSGIVFYDPEVPNFDIDNAEGMYIKSTITSNISSLAIANLNGSVQINSDNGNGFVEILGKQVLRDNIQYQYGSGQGTVGSATFNPDCFIVFRPASFWGNMTFECNKNTTIPFRFGADYFEFIGRNGTGFVHWSGNTPSIAVPFAGNGKVGIGTLTPQSTFDVAGNITMRGEFLNLTNIPSKASGADTDYLCINRTSGEVFRNETGC